MSHNKISDNSNDHKYFSQWPQIVWALSRTPHDFTLWNIVKMVAGEAGECFLTTDDLATLSMMSVGKVSDSRQYLIEVGLLEGEVRKDPGYPQPVWHLRIPDIWEENIRWRRPLDSLKERIALKANVTGRLEKAGQLRAFSKEGFRSDGSLRDLSTKSLHNMKPSQYEEGPPQYEEGPPQYETKNNQKEIQKDNHHGAGAQSNEQDNRLLPVNGDSAPPKESLIQMSNSGDPDLVARAQLLALGLKAQEQAPQTVEKIRLANWQIKDSRCEMAVAAFLAATGLEVPATKTERGQWLAGVRDHLDEFGLDGLKESYEMAWNEYVPKIMEGEVDITHPLALTRKMRAIRQRSQLQAQSPTEEEIIFVDPQTGRKFRW